MTVRQLREWLLKQDDTATIAIKIDSANPVDGIFYGSFSMACHSIMKSSDFPDTSKGDGILGGPCNAAGQSEHT